MLTIILIVLILVNQQEIQGLFIKGDRAFKTGDYGQAVALFE